MKGLDLLTKDNSTLADSQENTPSHRVNNEINKALLKQDNDQELIVDIIDENLEKLCKKLCYGNRSLYQCTLSTSWSLGNNSKVLCEWGNASFDWMLGDLLHIQQQNKNNNREISLVENYYRKIVASSFFWERYKNWRFKRRLRVPDYIKVLDPDARQIFWWLHDRDSIENMAQRLSRTESEISALVSEIRHELHIRKRGYLLNSDVEVSLENLDPIESEEALSFSTSDTQSELKQQVKSAYQQLTSLEQFVIDAMVIDDLHATAVLSSLKTQAISLSTKYSYEEMNTQHIYYFLRKTLSKLKRLSGILDEH